MNLQQYQLFTAYLLLLNPLSIVYAFRYANSVCLLSLRANYSQGELILNHALSECLQPCVPNAQNALLLH
jgi:hypothetical protein